MQQSPGDVIIDCTTSQCSNTKININALGRVNLQGGGVYGDIRSNNIVSIASATGTSQITKVNNIYTTNKVYLTGNTQANLIHANGDVLLTSTAKAEDIYSNGNIELSFAQAKNMHKDMSL